MLTTTFNCVRGPALGAALATLLVAGCSSPLDADFLDAEPNVDQLLLQGDDSTSAAAGQALQTAPVLAPIGSGAATADVSSVNQAITNVVGLFAQALAAPGAQPASHNASEAVWVLSASGLSLRFTMRKIGAGLFGWLGEVEQGGNYTTVFGAAFQRDSTIAARGSGSGAIGIDLDAFSAAAAGTPAAIANTGQILLGFRNGNSGGHHRALLQGYTADPTALAALSRYLDVAHDQGSPDHRWIHTAGAADFSPLGVGNLMPGGLEHFSGRVRRVSGEGGWADTSIFAGTVPAGTAIFSRECWDATGTVNYRRAWICAQPDPANPAPILLEGNCQQAAAAAVGGSASSDTTDNPNDASNFTPIRTLCFNGLSASEQATRTNEAAADLMSQSMAVADDSDLTVGSNGVSPELPNGLAIGVSDDALQPPVSLPPGDGTFPIPGPPRSAIGVHATFVAEQLIQQAQTYAYADGGLLPDGGLPPYPNPAMHPDPTDAILQQYFAVLLGPTDAGSPSEGGRMVSGLTAEMGWSVLNPGNPDNLNEVGAYAWNFIDDLIAAADAWNKADRGDAGTPIAPMTVQLIVNPGMNAPAWLFEQMDATPGSGTCDGLFSVLNRFPSVCPPSPSGSVSANCGYTGVFNGTDGASTTLHDLPMPWNTIYKSAWRTFLTRLNHHLQNLPPERANVFVQLSIAGPTATSSELIMPNNSDQSNNPCFTAINAADAGISIDANLVWNTLFANHYYHGTGSPAEPCPSGPYCHSERAFVEEWKYAMNMYGKIFSGITLDFTATGGGLPTFPNPDPTVTTPAAGLAPLCGVAPGSADAGMGCVAITDILAHLTLPSVAPADGKAIQEDGMTAARGDNNPDVIKWVSAWSSSGLAASPLATPLPVSRVLGGLQFNNSFSSEKNHNGTPYTDLDWEGCAVENPDGGSCGITAEQGLYNVLQIYFDGTDAGPFYGVSAGVTPDADAGTLFEFSDAPMNYVQVYDTDIIYANGMGGCRNLSDIFNDTHSCAVLVSSMPTISIDGGSYTAQGLLTLVNQQISLLSESTEPTPPKVSKLPGACLVYEACSTPAGFQPPGCDPDSPGCNFVNQCQTEPLTFNGDAPPDCIPGSVKGELGLSLPSCVGSCQ